MLTRLIYIGLCLGSLVSSVAHADEEAIPRAWLERMEQSLVSKNYDGRFIHSSESQSESLRIVHRNKNGKVVERLVSMDGGGREFIRTDNTITYYMPDKRTVVVERRNDGDAFLALIPSYREGLELYYDITLGQVTKVMGRQAQLVSIQPRDVYRYGYRIWLDTESAMPLKSQLLDPNGHVIEQMAFAELQLRDRIPDIDLQPSVNAKNYEWIQHKYRRRTISRDSIGWRAEHLPPGFKLQFTMLQPMSGSDVPVRHLVYSDGLASVSIFIERQALATGQLPKPLSGLQKIGSTFAVFKSIQDFQITGVGEAPAVTIKAMVDALVRDVSR